MERQQKKAKEAEKHVDVKTSNIYAFSFDSPDNLHF